MTSKAFGNVFKLDSLINVKDPVYGAKGDGTTDDTAALTAAYAAAAAIGATLIIPVGTYKFTSQLTWNGRVNILGLGQQEKVNLLKSFNGTGVLIDVSGQYCCYENFQVTGDTGNTGVGIKIDQGHYIQFRNVISREHGSHGIHITDGLIGKYENVLSVQNGGDGIRLEELAGGVIDANLFINVSCTVNTGWGFNLVSGNANVSVNMTCEQNTAGGLRVDAGAANNLMIYLELNTGPECQITSNATRTCIISTQGDTFDSAIEDDGVNTTLFGPGLSSGFIAVQGVTAPKPKASSAGRTTKILGGPASATGTNAGGDVRLTGGDGFNGGAQGVVAVGGRAFYPCDATGALQTACAIFAGSGAPNNTNGADGDYYFRSDGTAAGNTCIYHKQSGSWVALITT